MADTYAADYGEKIRYSAGADHADFHRMLHADNRDRTTALVYADWLQDHGHDAEAEIVRHHVDYVGDGANDGPDFDVYAAPPKAFRGVGLNNRDGTYSVVLSRQSDAVPDRRFQWLTPPLPAEEARRLLRRVKENGGFIPYPSDNELIDLYKTTKPRRRRS